MKSQPLSPEVIAFLKNERVLVVEPSVPFAQSIMSFLKDLGMPSQSMFHVRRYGDAQVAIHTQKPKILITEYTLDNSTGVALVSSVLEHHEESSKIAILITHDAGSSSIAEAAEERVDAYFLKPISISEFPERFIKTISSKIQATPFQQKIRSAKSHLKNKEFILAITEFEEAKQLQPNSALLHYYLGQCYASQNKVSEAIAEFDLGLEINAIHYKCLLGKFDILFEHKEFTKAYQVGKIISAYFPLSPKRLANILVSAVFSQNLEDVEKYYEIYKNLEARTPELTKIFSAALSTAGKHYLKTNSIAHADQCFQLGASVIGADITYLEAVARELLKARAPKEAQYYLSLFPAQEIGKKTHCQLSFLIGIQIYGNQDEVLDKGKKLLAQNFADRECYLQFISFLVEFKRITLAEDVAAKAIKEFPELRKHIYDMIEGPTV